MYSDNNVNITCSDEPSESSCMSAGDLRRFIANFNSLFGCLAHNFTDLVPSQGFVSVIFGNGRQCLTAKEIHREQDDYIQRVARTTTQKSIIMLCCTSWMCKFIC